MVKVKWDKLCGMDQNEKLGRIIWDGGSIILSQSYELCIQCPCFDGKIIKG